MPTEKAPKPRRPISRERFAKWVTMYTAELKEAALKDPANYFEAATPTGLAKVAKRMEGAFFSGSYNKDSRAIKAVCKALGIKDTYREIEDYLRPAGTEKQHQLIELP